MSGFVLNKQLYCYHLGSSNYDFRFQKFSFHSPLMYEWCYNLKRLFTCFGVYLSTISLVFLHKMIQTSYLFCKFYSAKFNTSRRYQIEIRRWWISFFIVIQCNMFHRTIAFTLQYEAFRMVFCIKQSRKIIAFGL